MLSAVAWVPKGAARAVPVVADPNEEDIKAWREAVEGEGEERPDEETEEDEDEGEEDEGRYEAGEDASEVRKAQAIANEMGKGGRAPRTGKDNKSGAGLGDVASELAELNMDTYDEEDEREVNLFGTGRGLGGMYYRTNEEDPFLVQDEEDEDEDEIDDLTIRPTDLLLLTARNEDDVSFLELWVCEEPGVGDEEPNMYVHHDVMLPAFPLSLAWMDFDPRAGGDESGTVAGGAGKGKGSQGNLVAVGTMNPEIEIWDLDVLDEVEPAGALGGFIGNREAEIKGGKDKGKGAKGVSGKVKKGKKEAVLKVGSHKGAVMALAWNREFRNVLASGGEDQCVKVWDMATQACQYTLSHHDGKVQSVAWCPLQPTVLLSGSFDHTVALVDGRVPMDPCRRWGVSADVEALAWDPHNEHRFLVSTEDGLVKAFDQRAGKIADCSAAGKGRSRSGKKAAALPGTEGASGDVQGTGSPPLFTLGAHDRATCTMSFNPGVPHLLATGSMDKKVKLWDLNEDQPKCLATHNPAAGAVFSVSFCPDVPTLLAVGGSKGVLKLWDVSREKAVGGKFGRDAMQME